MVLSAEERRVNTYFTSVEKARVFHDALNTGLQFTALYAITDNGTLDELVKSIKKVIALNKKRITASDERSEAVNAMIAKKEKVYIHTVVEVPKPKEEKPDTRIKTDKRTHARNCEFYKDHPERLRKYKASVVVVPDSVFDEPEFMTREERERDAAVRAERLTMGRRKHRKKKRIAKELPVPTEDQEKAEIAEINRVAREKYNAPVRGYESGEGESVSKGAWMAVVAESKVRRGLKITREERTAMKTRKLEMDRERKRREASAEANDQDQLAVENARRAKLGRKPLTMAKVRAGAKIREASEEEQVEEEEEARVLQYWELSEEEEKEEEQVVEEGDISSE
jgi:hypothetical protein